ncbi:MAG: 30S ribosomal protein S9 [Spirochaetota bacterium]
MQTKNEVWTVGRRKTSIARVKLMDGTGKITINKKDMFDYLKVPENRAKEILKPLQLVNQADKYDIKINVKGGGFTGQIGAIKHALSRALCEKAPDTRSPLKKEGFLTRDSRMVERKKYGLHKARRGTQFSKR